ncbi:MAG: tetratricopeptide repeat protein [Leptospirillia bacterium]
MSLPVRLCAAVVLSSAALLSACQSFSSPGASSVSGVASGSRTGGVKQETRIPLGGAGHPDPAYPWQAYYHEIAADVALTLDNPYLAKDEVEKALAYRPASVYLGLMKAHVLLKTGDLKGAELQARGVAAKHPSRLGPWLTLGTILQIAAAQEVDPEKRKADLRQIVDVYRKHVLTLDPLKDEAYIALSDVYSKEGRPDKSRAILEEGVRRSKSSDYLPFYLGFQEERNGNIGKAIALYRLALQRNPRFAPALGALGDLYSKQGDWEDARTPYERLLSMEDVGRIDLEVKLLKTYFALKLYPQAVDLLKRAIYEHPRNNRLPLILSSLLVQESRYDEAIRQIEGILKSHPEDPRLLSFLGSVYEKSLHFTRAIATYRLMIHRFPNLYEGSYNLGDLYRRLENDSKAVVYLEEAESLSAERWEIPFSLALARMDQKRYPEAIAEIRRARTISPKNPILLFNEAILYDQWDHKRYLPKVLDLLHRSLALDRGFSDALNYLGYTQVLMKKDLVGARYMILRALTDDPKNGAYRDSLGWLYDRQGHYVKALREESRALSAMPHDPTVLDHMGRIEHHLALALDTSANDPARTALLRALILGKKAQGREDSLKDLSHLLLIRSQDHLRTGILIHPLHHHRVLRYLSWYGKEDPSFIPELRKAVALYGRLHPEAGRLTLYRVHEGDTLQSIAAKENVYGTPRLWRRLLEANRSLVTNPNEIPWGTILRIPPPPHPSRLRHRHRKAARSASLVGTIPLSVSKDPM